MQKPQQVHSALGQFVHNPIAQELDAMQAVAAGVNQSADGMATGNLSPLELLDQTEDDERLLQALEGLTLDLDNEPKNLDTKVEAASADAKSSEPTSDHGTRSEFIRDVSEKLIVRVNQEAGDIEQAKVLMQQYMLEFCAEYDRCGYGGAKKTCSDAKSESTASSQNSDKKQMAFDNQILKKGVRVLSKNLQKVHEQSRIKDQQVKVMRNFLVHQNQQITALKEQLAQLQSHEPTSAVDAQKLSIVHSKDGDFSTTQAQPDSAMVDPQPALTLQQHQQKMRGAADAANSDNNAQMLSRTLHLQSMKFQRNNDQQNPDIF